LKTAGGPKVARGFKSHPRRLPSRNLPLSRRFGAGAGPIGPLPVYRLRPLEAAGEGRSLVRNWYARRSGESGFRLSGRGCQLVGLRMECARRNRDPRSRALRFRPASSVQQERASANPTSGGREWDRRGATPLGALPDERWHWNRLQCPMRCAARWPGIRRRWRSGTRYTVAASARLPTGTADLGVEIPMSAYVASERRGVYERRIYWARYENAFGQIWETANPADPHADFAIFPSSALRRWTVERRQRLGRWFDERIVDRRVWQELEAAREGAVCPTHNGSGFGLSAASARRSRRVKIVPPLGP
jgi:hypothetical protein